MDAKSRPSTSDEGRITLAPDRLNIAIKTAIAADRPVCIWSKPGQGKSQIVYQVAAELGRPLYDVRLSTVDNIDLRGAMTIENGLTRWAPPGCLPQRPGGILFLDEFNRPSVPSVLNVMLQVSLDRRVADYTLPDQTAIVAACNPTDRGVVELPGALRERFLHLWLQNGLEPWTEWARTHAIHPLIVAFLHWRPTMLDAVSPRSWTYASDVLKQRAPQDVEMALLVGTTGQGAGSEFEAFIRRYKELPNINGLLDNPEDPRVAPVPKDVSTLFSIVSAISYILAGAQVPDRPRLMAGATRYAQRLPQDYAVFMLRDATAREPELCKTRAYLDWANDHQVDLK